MVTVTTAVLTDFTLKRCSVPWFLLIFVMLSYFNSPNKSSVHQQTKLSRHNNDNEPSGADCYHELPCKSLRFIFPVHVRPLSPGNSKLKLPKTPPSAFFWVCFGYISSLVRDAGLCVTTCCLFPSSWSKHHNLFRAKIIIKWDWAGSRC